MPMTLSAIAAGHALRIDFSTKLDNPSLVTHRVTWQFIPITDSVITSPWVSNLKLDRGETKQYVTVRMGADRLNSKVLKESYPFNSGPGHQRSAMGSLGSAWIFYAKLTRPHSTHQTSVLFSTVIVS